MNGWNPISGNSNYISVPTPQHANTPVNCKLNANLENKLNEIDNQLSANHSVQQISEQSPDVELVIKMCDNFIKNFNIPNYNTEKNRELSEYEIIEKMFCTDIVSLEIKETSNTGVSKLIITKKTVTPPPGFPEPALSRKTPPPAVMTAPENKKNENSEIKSSINVESKNNTPVKQDEKSGNVPANASNQNPVAKKRSPYKSNNKNFDKPHWNRRGKYITTSNSKKD